MERTSLQRIMQRNRDHVNRRTRMPQPDVASLLTDNHVAESLQCAD